MKKMVLRFLVATFTPLMLQAGGIGLYIPYSIGHSVDGTMSDDDDNYGYYDYDRDYDYKLKSKAGFGLAYATNLGKDKVFGYKIALEYTMPQGKNSIYSAERFDLINTFEFAVYRNRVVRLWAGPRINIGFESDDYYNEMELGIAPAFGINVNFGKYVAIAFDVDYKFGFGYGTLESNDATYTQLAKGPTARLGLFIKFAETFD